MEMKHTVGPWVVGSWGGRCEKTHEGMRGHPGAAHATDPCEYKPLLFDGCGGIAGPGGAMVVRATYDGLEMSDADAHLIAAAPELLALLIESQDSIGGDWRKRRDAAIAKALDTP